MKKKNLIIFAVVLVFILAAINFPVYRLLYFADSPNYFSQSELQKVMYIGSPWDILQAQEVMNLANAAFSDVQHTSAENAEMYGLLSRYATAADLYEDAAFNKHSLDLWSAHLGKDEGWLWVYYSSETLNREGGTVRGSWRVPSLWKVEKTDAGNWTVTKIKEHP